jgi:osmotically-inducible protein OsmY
VINVNSYRGVVQLSGFVDSAEKIERAATAARNVQGVRSVENNIQVKPAS